MTRDCQESKECDTSTKDAGSDQIECALGGSRRSKESEPRGRASVRVDPTGRRGQGRPRRRMNKNTQVGRSDDHSRGQGGDAPPARAPHERRDAQRQSPRGTAGQDEDGQTRAARVHAAWIGRRGLDTGGTRDHKGCGGRHAVGGQNRQGNVREGSSQDPVCRTHEQGRGQRPREGHEETHAQRGREATGGHPCGHRGKRR